MSSAVGTSDEVDRVRRSLSTGAPAWCSYYGVTCNSNSTSATYASVTQISLVSQGLVGTIPSSIGSLTSLTFIEFGSNSLYGAIPRSIGSMTSLVSLYFDTNSLGGTIPSSIGSLTLLQTLWIGNNRLSGSIPSRIGSLMGVMAAFSPSLTLWLLSHDF